MADKTVPAAFKPKAGSPNLPNYLEHGTGDNLAMQGEEWEDPGAKDAYLQLSEWLTEWGLGGLDEWVREQMVSGSSDAEVALEIYQTPEFKERFPAIDNRKANGLSAISPAEYIEFERRGRQLMSANGLPKGFYDDVSDFTEFLSSDVSLVELEGRITEGYRKVTESGVEVRSAFANYYGIQGDDMLAALFLDPDKAAPLLERQATSAMVGGTADRYGIDLARMRAERLTDLGVDRQRAQQGFGRIQELSDTFKESLGVRDQQDLTAEEHGVGMEFEGNNTYRTSLQRRAGQRAGSTTGGGGAAVESEGSALGRTERT